MGILTTDIISLLILLAIGHGIFLGLVFIFHTKGSLLANRYFGSLLISFSISILYGILIQTGLYKSYPHLNRVGYPFQLLFGPLLYLYIKTIQGKIVKKSYLHLIPFIILILIMIPYFRLSGADKIFYVENPHLIKSILPFFLIDIFIQIHLWIYLIIIMNNLKKHNKEIKENYSYLKGVNLSWIKNIIFQLAITFLVLLIHTLIITISNEVLFIADYRIIPLLVSIFIFIAGYKAFMQKEIFHPEEVKTSIIKKTETPITKEVLNYMEKNKPYLNPEITLTELASEIDLTRNKLSSIINNSQYDNFFDFINRYRVEEVKKCLMEPSKDRFTLLAISQECGFNSKATFNSVFKKVTGVTPSTFKKNRDL